MNKYRLVLIGVITGFALTVGFLWISPANNTRAERGQVPAAATPGPSSDEGSAPWQILSTPGADETLPNGLSGDAQAPGVLPTQIPGETLVYFVPSDNDATGTVLTLYNTDSVAHVVALRGFNYDGAMVYAQNINIGATSLLRLISNSVAAAPPPSWATPAPVTTNFTDFVYFASMSLPKGVKVEGYIIFNPGTGTVNPRADQGAIPLRFSTDPASVFLPMASNP